MGASRNPPPTESHVSAQAQTTDSSSTGGQFTFEGFLGEPHTNPPAYGPLGSTSGGTTVKRVGVGGRRALRPQPCGSGAIERTETCSPPPPARRCTSPGREGGVREVSGPFPSVQGGEGGVPPPSPPEGGVGGW